MTRIFLVVFGILLALCYVSVAQETQTNLPVSMSFGYEHPSGIAVQEPLSTSTQHIEASEEELAPQSTQPIASPDTNAYRVGESERENNALASSSVELHEQDQEQDQDSTVHPRRTATQTIQLSDDGMNITTEITPPNRRLNETKHDGSNSTTIKRTTISSDDEPEVKRSPSPTITRRRNTNSTTITDREGKIKKSSNTTEIENENNNSSKNATDVIFPGGRGHKNETKDDNSAVSGRSSASTMGLVTLLLAALVVLDL